MYVELKPIKTSSCSAPKTEFQNLWFIRCIGLSLRSSWLANFINFLNGCSTNRKFAGWRIELRTLQFLTINASLYREYQQWRAEHFYRIFQLLSKNARRRTKLFTLTKQPQIMYAVLYLKIFAAFLVFRKALVLVKCALDCSLQIQIENLQQRDYYCVCLQLKVV